MINFLKIIKIIIKFLLFSYNKQDLNKFMYQYNLCEIQGGQQ